MVEPMSHDAAREWIDHAFVTPGMRDDDDPLARAVRAHLSTCVECGAYDQATRRAAMKLDIARGPSPEVRQRTMAAARRLSVAGVTGAASARPVSGVLSWRLAALVLVVAVLGAGAGAWWANATRSDDLADAVALMSQLATTPGMHEVVLRDAAGNGSGIAVMSAASHQLSVLATNLPAGIEYHCYFERGGQRTWIGTMYVEAGVQYWAGQMEAALEMQPGDMLIVAADETAPAVIRATL